MHFLRQQTPAVTIVAKSDVRHVEQALKTSLDENVSMVRDTVAFLVGEGRRSSWTSNTSSTGTATTRTMGFECSMQLSMPE